jgi:hypothetical protein
MPPANDRGKQIGGSFDEYIYAEGQHHNAQGPDGLGENQYAEDDGEEATQKQDPPTSGEKPGRSERRGFYGHDTLLGVIALHTYVDAGSSGQMPQGINYGLPPRGKGFASAHFEAASRVANRYGNPEQRKCTLKTSILVRALLLCSISAACALAQNPADELQELKAKVQQLQQQIANIEQRLKAQGAQTSPPANAPATPLPTTYIGKETRERQTVSDFPEEAPRINNEELDPTLRGFFRIPGLQTLVNLRGFVKTDLFYDLNMAGFWYGGMVPSSFPSSPQPKSRNSTVSIRPSRFVVEFRQPLGNDTLKGFVDWDLYGTNGRNTPNVRSFWGQYKNFLAGQTWSAFGDPDAFPDTLDFHGAPG